MKKYLVLCLLFLSSFGATAQAQIRAYVINEFSNTVSVIDTATNTVVADIFVGVYVFPSGIAITPAPQAPKSKEECKHGGYLKFGPPAGPFKNQGQCVSYVKHHSH